MTKTHKEPGAARPERSGSSDFQKRGGYPSNGKPITQLPKAPTGPAPGGKKPKS